MSSDDAAPRGQHGTQNGISSLDEGPISNSIPARGSGSGSGSQSDFSIPPAVQALMASAQASTQQTPQEFLVPPEQFLEQVVPLLAVDTTNLLVVGCGDSDFSAQLCAALVHEESSVVSMDNDETCIAAMREAHPAMQWDIEDATAMGYADSSFDAVLDKSLLDFLIYTQRKPKETYAMLAECARVCRVGRKCIFLSWCPPKEMQVHMAGCPWRVETVQLEAPCDATGRVPLDGTVSLVGRGDGFVWAEQQRCSKSSCAARELGLYTDFYIYVCTREAAKEFEPSGSSAEDKAEDGDFVAAIELFSAQVAVAACDEKLYESLAQCYLMCDEAEEVALAVVFAAKASQLAPEWGVGHLTLARAHMAVSHFGLAVESFTKAVELDPSLEAEVAEDLATATAQRDEGRARLCGAC